MPNRKPASAAASVAAEGVPSVSARVPASTQSLERSASRNGCVSSECSSRSGSSASCAFAHAGHFRDHAGKPSAGVADAGDVFGKKSLDDRSNAVPGSAYAGGSADCKRSAEGTTPASVSSAATVPSRAPSCSASTATAVVAVPARAADAASAAHSAASVAGMAPASASSRLASVSASARAPARAPSRGACVHAKKHSPSSAAARRDAPTGVPTAAAAASAAAASAAVVNVAASEKGVSSDAATAGAAARASAPGWSAAHSARVRSSATRRSAERGIAGRPPCRHRSGSGGSPAGTPSAASARADACRHVSHASAGVVVVARGGAAFFSRRSDFFVREVRAASSPPSRPPSFESVACIVVPVAVRSGASTSTSMLPAPRRAAASPSAPIAARSRWYAVAKFCVAVASGGDPSSPWRMARAGVDRASASSRKRQSCASRNAAMAPSISSRALSRTDSLVGPGFSPKSPETATAFASAPATASSNAAAASSAGASASTSACARAPRPRVSGCAANATESWSAEATSAVTAAREIATDVCAAPRAKNAKPRAATARSAVF